MCPGAAWAARRGCYARALWPASPRVGLAAIFATIVAAALGLRLWGIGFGLPYLYHPDEPQYVLQALAVARGLPNGLTFANPPLEKYLLTGAYAATYVVDKLRGTVATPQDFIDQFRANPGPLYLVGRVLSAVIGASTVLAMGWLAALLGGGAVGASAALLGAATYLLVRESHFAVNDALVTLLVTLALGGCLKVHGRGRRRDSVLAGALVGLAFAAKYQGAAAAVPLLLAHLLPRAPGVPQPGQAPGASWPDSRVRHLGWAVGAGVVAGLVAFPSLVTEPGRVLQDIYVHLWVPGQSGYDGLDPRGGYVYYAWTLGLGLGWPLLLSACLMMAMAVLRRDPRLLVVASLPAVLYATLGAERMYFARFLLPAVPALVVLGSLLVVDLARRSARYAPLVGGTLLMLLAGAPLIDSLRLDQLLVREDTRTQAHDFVLSGLPSGAKVAVDAPPLGPVLSAPQGDVVIANDWSLFDLGPDEYAARGIDYVVLSSFTADAPLVDPLREGRRRAFNDWVAQHGQVVARFSPERGDDPGFVYDRIYGPFDELQAFDRPGPTITIVRLDTPR